MISETRLSMRHVFGEHLAKLGEEIPELFVLDADVSSSTQTCRFAEKFPERFINCGIAEANMVSVGAGLAASGMKPVVSSFAYLLATRSLDQVRSQIAYNKLPVIIAGGYAGLSDFADGGSHQSIEDIACFSVMPNMTVICPGDANEVEMALEAALAFEGPVYLRLSRAEAGRLPCQTEFEIGKSFLRRKGKDVALIVTGQMLETAIEAVQELERIGVDAMLVDMHTLKPLDRDAVMMAAKACGAIVTCEEGSVIGGLGSMVAGFLSCEMPTPIKMIGIQDAFGQSGAYESLCRYYGLTSGDIVEASLSLLKGKGAKL